jgi:hypothetical protein
MWLPRIRCNSRTNLSHSRHSQMPQNNNSWVLQLPELARDNKSPLRLKLILIYWNPVVRHRAHKGVSTGPDWLFRTDKRTQRLHRPNQESLLCMAKHRAEGSQLRSILLQLVILPRGLGLIQKMMRRMSQNQHKRSLTIWLLVSFSLRLQLCLKLGKLIRSRKLALKRGPSNLCFNKQHSQMMYRSLTSRIRLRLTSLMVV